MTLRMSLPGEPPTATHHAKRIVYAKGKAFMADKKELKEAMDSLESRLLPHYKNGLPYGVPIKLTIRYWFRPTKGMLSTRRGKDHFESGGTIPKRTKPDLSNLNKTLEDTLVRVGFIDCDQNVVTLISEKAHRLEPGIDITIEYMEETQ